MNKEADILREGSILPLSHIKCHLSRVTCHMSLDFFLRQIGKASWLKVCYQRRYPVPHLVLGYPKKKMNSVKVTGS